MRRVFLLFVCSSIRSPPSRAFRYSNRCYSGHIASAIFSKNDLLSNRGNKRRSLFLPGTWLHSSRFSDLAAPRDEDSYDSRKAGGSAWEDSSWAADEPTADRWERVWQEGETQKKKSLAFGMVAGEDDEYESVNAESAMPVEIVSFDLDDTLWSTKRVIDAANSALQDYLRREHPALAKCPDIPDLMKEIWKKRMIKNPKLGRSPVNLTELRKAALRLACEQTGTDPSGTVEACFEFWRKTRHDVEPYLFPGVLSTLKALRQRGVRLIAITNGNADTDDIPCLRDLFEFCIMAEKVGERKPDSGPFRAAIKRAGYESEDNVGGEWVHVGDDWASDCVGAKAMRMRTILVKVPGSLSQTDAQSGVDDDTDYADAGSLDEIEEDEEDYKGAGHVGAAWRLDEAREKTAQAVEKLGFTTEGEVVPEVVIVSRRAEALRAEKRAEEAQRQAEEAQKRGVRKGEVQRRTRESVSGDSENATGATGSRGFWSAKGEARIMSMGSSSYLADSIKLDFMDAEADTISDVLAIVDRWNRKYSETFARLRSSVERNSAEALRGSADASEKQPAVGSAGPAARAAAEDVRDGKPSNGMGDRTGADAIADRKFCMECGQQIPAVAKFCPECGSKQARL